MRMFRSGMWGVLALVAALVLSACSNKGRLAPVDDHSVSATRGAARVLPGSENAGKPGYYTVKPGDTLIRIGMDHGQSGRDIARWNKLENPNLIETGQVLRVLPPGPDAPVTKPTSSASGTNAPPMPSAPATPTPPAANAAPAGAEDTISFQWPARGNLISGFDESKNKGLDIGGKVGDPVMAAADGRVVYAGAGLRGYGNLIILKHNNTYLTAYAHNQTLLVKEDQVIKRGQKIAEMGNSDADQVKLHFEIRRQGKPVDPAKYLSAN
ncbi:peptidoglycan DD-metalloendopeptidase family protein [Limnohabitans sp. MORI2]|uniref:peptidoglycan DD-metalloendopeptidase family protein n=1 Tax=Limnohabitans sp. MORI2 TaxID=1751150 RepID=UPI0024919C86|nr:peptidoglycan DD-metalloendopeptidase family protein [Limnohabitans sp. MORI2]